MLRLRTVGCAGLLLNLLLAAAAAAQYRFDTWTTDRGLPQNSVTTLLQSRDGYLWLGTFGGLVRFDGAKFTVFDSGTHGPRSLRILALYEDRAGAIWIGTERGGLTRYANGTFTTYTTRDGLPIDTVGLLSGDRHGRIWSGTSVGLVRFEAGRFTTFTERDGLPAAPSSPIVEDRQGRLWFGTPVGLVRFSDGRFTTFTTRDGLPDTFVTAIHEAADGGLWVGTRRAGVVRFVPDGEPRATAVFSTTHGLPHDSVRCLLLDRSGNLWIGTGKGLGVLRPAARTIVAYDKKNGLPDETINSLAEDREGNLWVGAGVGGLVRVKTQTIVAYGRDEGLPGDGVVPIAEAADGTLWIGMTCGGLVRVRGGISKASVKTYDTRDGLPDNCVWSLLPRADGSLWLGTWGGGLTRFKDGRFTTWRQTPAGEPLGAVLALHEDRAGVLWIGTGVGLFRYADDHFTVFRPRDGLVHEDVRFVTSDRHGALWIGTTGGVSRFEDGRFTNYTTVHGLSNDAVRAIHQTADGALWFGTYGGGLTRLKDGRFTRMTTEQGLFENVVSRILEDDRGYFWMTGNKGVVRVSRQTLEDYADGKRGSITSVAFGVTDGMKSSECNGGGQPAGWKRRDGTLWFPTARGVVAIDPARVASHDQPPPVAIERALVNGRDQDLRRDIEVPAGRGDLEIHYTGLSFSAPDQVRFKYQLAGLDPDWTDAGTRRAVYYSHLPPGRYRFAVIAANVDGVWSPSAAHLSLQIVPPFYQTWWFLGLAAMSVAGAGLVAHERRLGRLRRAKAAQEAFSHRLIESQEHERKRIAAELHDGLSQTLVVIKRRALLGRQTPGDRQELLEQMDEIAEAAADAIDEVREIAYNLRPSQLDRIGLTKALDVMLRTVAATNGLRVRQHLDPLEGLFTPDVEIHVYRIVQEGVTNIVKHAGATEAAVTVTRAPDGATIEIRDNGRGFVPGASSPAGGPGGFGLAGMAERARLFGSELIVHAAPGQGTAIRVTLKVKGDHHGRRDPDPDRG